MESRIPARPALCVFVPTGTETDPFLAELQRRFHQSRWFPVAGGHRVLMPFDDGPYDASRCAIEAGAWDHEHCECCGDRIPAMTLCHVTEPGEPYILVCSGCYARHVTR
jgi:hypothetical protein